MKTKLTLRIDDALIRRAKAYARRQNTSVSQLVAGFLTVLDGGDAAGGSVSSVVLPPPLMELYGCLSPGTVDEGDYRKYIEEKHG